MLSISINIWHYSELLYKCVIIRAWFGCKPKTGGRVASLTLTSFPGRFQAAEKRPGIDCSRMRQIPHDSWGIGYLRALLVISATCYRFSAAWNRPGNEAVQICSCVILMNNINMADSYVISGSDLADLASVNSLASQTLSKAGEGTW